MIPQSLLLESLTMTYKILIKTALIQYICGFTTIKWNLILKDNQSRQIKLSPPIEIYLEQENIEVSVSKCLLGVQVDKNLNWKNQIIMSSKNASTFRLLLFCLGLL